MQSLIKKIKQKKELSGITDKIVSELLLDYLKKYSISLKNISPKQTKIIIKEIRSQLRTISGQFQKGAKNREKLLETDSIQQLLKTHSSTAERLEFYPELKSIIKRLKVTSILDIGCGLNPIALANSGLTYYASDIKEDELSLIKRFFKKNKIKGKLFVQDLTKSSLNFPKTDICLILKVLDTIDPNHVLTETLLKKVHSKYFIISFSTKKLSGKPMNFPRRRWFEKLLVKLNFHYKTFQSQNEIFYLITKQTPKTTSPRLKLEKKISSRQKNA